MKNRLIIAVLFISANIFASGGSTYTRFGIGDLLFSHSAAQLSLGGIGTSLNSSKYVNTVNPASIFNIEFTRFGGGLISNSHNIDDGLNSALYSKVLFSGFHLALPVEKDLGIGFMLGMEPYSTVNYSIENSVDDTFGQYTELFEGSGGISKIFIGISYVLPGEIPFGITFDYYTGNIKYNSYFNYADSLGYLDSRFTNESKYKGLGTTLGLQSPDLAEIFDLEGFSNFRLGAFYEIHFPMNTDSLFYAQTSVGSNTLESDNFKTDIPAKLGVGLSFTLQNKYIFLFDYLNQPWSNYEKNGFKSPYLRNLSRYSLGFEYGDQSKRFASFWELIKYRCGLSYEQSQYEVNGEGIDQFGIHAGFSFPLGLSNSVDIGFMYGIRGKTDNNLLKENILQASFSLNFGELWFIRQDR